MAPNRNKIELIARTTSSLTAVCEVQKVMNYVSNNLRIEEALNFMSESDTGLSAVLFRRIEGKM